MPRIWAMLTIISPDSFFLPLQNPLYALESFWAQSPQPLSALVSLSTLQQKMYFQPHCQGHRMEGAHKLPSMELRPPCVIIWGAKTTSKGKGSGTEKGETGQNDHPLQSLTFPGIPGPRLGPNPSQFAKNCDSWFCGSATNPTPASSD